jgi:hypothetical protein
LTTHTNQCQKTKVSEVPRPGRLQIGTPGGFTSESAGDFVGISKQFIRILILLRAFMVEGESWTAQIITEF